MEETNNKEKNKKTIMILGAVLLVILLILSIVLIFRSNKLKETDKSNNKENNTVKKNESKEENGNSNNNKKKEIIHLDKTAIFNNKDKTLGEEAIARLNNNSSQSFFYYRNDIKEISSDKISDETKLNLVLDYYYNQLQDKSNFGKIIKRENIESILYDMFKDSKINLNKEFPNTCHKWVYKYNKKYDGIEVYKKAEPACGAIPYVYNKSINEVKKGNKLIVKTKAIQIWDTFEYIDSNNNYATIDDSESVCGDKIPPVDAGNENWEPYYECGIDKYYDYANEFEWTFVKNKNGIYVFDKVKRIK